MNKASSTKSTVMSSFTSKTLQQIKTKMASSTLGMGHSNSSSNTNNSAAATAGSVSININQSNMAASFDNQCSMQMQQQQQQQQQAKSLAAAGATASSTQKLATKENMPSQQAKKKRTALENISNANSAASSTATLADLTNNTSTMSSMSSTDSLSSNHQQAQAGGKDAASRKLPRVSVAPLSLVKGATAAAKSKPAAASSSKPAAAAKPTLDAATAMATLSNETLIEHQLATTKLESSNSSSNSTMPVVVMNSSTSSSVCNSSSNNSSSSSSIVSDLSDSPMSDEAAVCSPASSSSSSASSAVCALRASEIAGWKDIDADDAADEFTSSTYVRHIFDYYREREARFTIGDYIRQQPHINKQMRLLLVDWMVEVQQQLEFNHEVLYLSVKLLDLYLNARRVEKEKLQLLGGAAMFIACKFEERMPPIIDDFIYVSDNAYDRNELVKMEIDILKTVRFDIGVPLSYTFLRRYSKCVQADMKFLTLARYVLELCLQDYQFAHVSESLKACASLYLALKMAVAYERALRSDEHQDEHDLAALDDERMANNMQSSSPLAVITQNLTGTEWVSQFFFS